MKLSRRRLLTLVAVAIGLGAQRALLSDRVTLGWLGLGLAALVLTVTAAPEARTLLALGRPPAALPVPDRLAAVATAVAAVAVVGSTLVFDVTSPTTAHWIVYLLSLVAVTVAVWLTDARRSAGPHPPPPDPLGLDGRVPRWVWHAALATVVLATALLAVVALGSTPRGLWFDEAETGLQARQILDDADYRPVWIDSTYDAPAHHAYLVAGSFALFGESVTSLRLVSALLGVTGVLGAWLVGRELAGPAVGLAAAATLGATRWYLTLERLAMFNIAVPVFALLTVGFVLRGWRRGRVADHALAGLAAGLGLCFYSAFAATLLAVGLLVVVVAVRWPRRAATTLGAAAVTAAVALAVVAPVARFVVSEPDVALARQRQTSLFEATPASERLGALMDNVADYVTMFNVSGDDNGRHNDPGEPQLSAWLAPLAVLGLGLMFAAVGRPLALFLLVWPVLSLVPGVLSLRFEAPNALRAVGALAPLVLAAVLVLAVVAVQWRDASGRARVATGALLVGVLMVAGATDVGRYFGAQTHDDAAWAVHSTAETFTAELLRDVGTDRQVWLTAEFRDLPTIEFLSPERRADGYFGTDVRLPLPVPADRDLVLVTTPAAPGVTDGVLDLYPHAVVQERRRAEGSPAVLIVVTIPAADLAAVQGYDTSAVDGPGPSPATERRAVLVVPDTRARELSLGGDGPGIVEVDGEVVFATGDVAGTGDERPVEPVTAIAGGRHELRVVTTSADDPVLWREPDGDWEPVPAHVLYRSPVQPWGLAARHIPGDDAAGAVAFTTIDPALDLRFHELRLPRPYVIRWEGALLVPTTGVWRLEVAADDRVELSVDGSVVAATTGGGTSAGAALELAEGRHDIVVVYHDTGSFSRVSLRWTSPTGASEVVPASALRPPWAADLPPAAPPATAAPPPAELSVARSIPLSGAVGVATAGDGRVYAVGADGLLVVRPDGTVERAPLDDPSPTDVAVVDDGRVVVLGESGLLEVFDPEGRALTVLTPPLDLQHSRGLAAVGPAEVAVAHTPGSRVVRLPIDAPSEAAVAWESAATQPVDVAATADGALAILLADAGKSAHAGRLVIVEADGHERTAVPVAPERTVAGPHLALDTTTGDLWWTEPSGALLVGTTPASSTRSALVGEPPLHPVGVAVADDGTMWLTDAEQGVVVQTQPRGALPD